MPQDSSTAALIIIGNEILSGRTQDANLNYLAKGLGEIGVTFAEARVIADDRQKIIDTVNQMRHSFDYVFTTGGIGPTHDDITAEAISAAFELPYTTHPIALEKLTEYYGKEKLNEGRLKMTKMPQGAKLIENAISAAPGFYVENVYVMAGIPNVMQAMFDTVRHSLTGGDPMLSAEVEVTASESMLASHLTALQEKFSDVEIGSYPFVKGIQFCVNVVFRCRDEARLHAAKQDFEATLKTLEI